MIPRTVRLLRDFKEDKRISMDVYADYLSKGIKKYPSGEYNVSEYTPTIPKSFRLIPNNTLKMRLLRYYSYPSQIQGLKQDIFHIIEHGYAHLLAGKSINDKAIVTAHDLIPMLQWKGLINGLIPGKQPMGSIYSLNRLEKARKIIAISESTKNDLVKLLGLNPNKIEVIYYGVGEEFFKKENKTKEELRHRLELPSIDTKLILITGEVLYKNHKTCLEVMEIVEEKYHKPVKMVKLGSDYAEWNKLEKNSNLKNNIIQINYLDLPGVADLYNCVDILLFPSLYEGFGRPPLEAMACGLPVVCSNAASLPEIVSDSGLMSDPEDAFKLSEQVLAVLNNKELRNSLIQKGYKNSERFSWRDNIEKTIALYNKVLDQDSNKTKKIVFFQRKFPFYGSIELNFSELRNYLSPDYNMRVLKSRYISQGIFKRLYNIFQAYFYQSDINHVTGDVHFLAYLMKKNKTILTIHDCGPVIHSKGIRRVIYKFFWFTLPSMTVNAITVNSEKTKKELMGIINYPEDKIYVISHCIKSTFLEGGNISSKIQSTYNGEKIKLIQIGTSENKNLDRICLAIKDMNCSLEIVGKLNAHQVEILRKNNIDYTNSSGLTEGELINKYLQADILIFVSTYEGLGVPVLEAQALGIPVVTSNISPMSETSGGAAILVDPYDIDQISRAIYKIIEDDDHRKKMISAGLENVKKYHPKIMANSFETVYKEIN